MQITMLLLMIYLLIYCSLTTASDLSLSLLYGDNYLIEPAEQTTATIEYATGWDRGDLFAFVDYKHFNDSNGANSWYGEFSPRFKLIDSELPLYAAFTWERGKNDTEAFLAGLGTNLSLPHFTFTKINIYYRDSPNFTGNSWQSTASWARPFFQDMLIFDGYIDWVFSSEEGAKNLHINPQLKWNMQKQFNTSLRWYLGIEYDYWNNKYAIDSKNVDSDQSTASLLFKAHF